jgi:hypothetical protein
MTNTTSPLRSPSPGGSVAVEGPRSAAPRRDPEAVFDTRPASARSWLPRSARSDSRGSGVSATNKLKYVATDAVGGPAYVVASVVGAVGLAVGGSIVLVAALLKERRYQAHLER